MYSMPSSLILRRTCLTSSSRPFALTWRSNSVMSVPRSLLCVHPIARRPARPRLAPRERTVGSRMQLAGREAREAERLEQLAALAADVLGHELADANHLVAVIRVGDHVDILAEAVEHREIVGRETADAAGRFAPVQVAQPLEAFLAEGERRAPHARKILADHEVRRFRPVRINAYRGRIRLDLER